LAGGVAQVSQRDYIADSEDEEGCKVEVREAGSGTGGEIGEERKGKRGDAE
jgi:hypothetical protein